MSADNQNYIHPDYNNDELPITDLASESKLLKSTVHEMLKDAEFADTGSACWLGTYQVNGKTYQMQLLLTESELIDEG